MKNLVFILIIAFTLPFIGCRSNDKDKLVGTWKQIPYTNPVDSDKTPFVYKWVFTGGDLLRIERTEQETEEFYIDTCSYSIDGDRLRIFDGTGPVNGEYWIDVLDKEYLKMTKKKSTDGESAWVRYEFVKE